MKINSTLFVDEVMKSDHKDSVKITGLELN